MSKSGSIVRTVSRSSVAWWPDSGATTSTTGWVCEVARSKCSNRQNGLCNMTLSVTATLSPLIIINGERVAVTESVMLHKPFCRLLHFERATSQTHPVVLVVAPLSGHHATLLRDTVRTMLPDFDIYLTEWIDARMVPMSEGGFHLDDYVAYV